VSSNAAGATTSPEVTVITPAYNVGKYIGQAVDSVLRQTFANFEYLLIDDGSTDGTSATALAHAGNDARFRLITGPNRGPGAARNVGLAESKAEFVAFLDGDDRWHDSFLDSQVRLIRSLSGDVGAVFCRSRMILENGTPIFVQWQRAGSYDFDDFLVYGCPARNGSSLLLRRSCFDDAGVFDENMPSAQDFDMWLRIGRGSATPIFWANRRFLVDLRLRAGSISRNRTARVNALQDLLAKNVPLLQRLPPALAYVGPALTALKYGNDSDVAAWWVREARSAGFPRLARSLTGVRFLFWSSLSASGQNLVRSAQRSSRDAVKRLDSLLRGSRPS
jgi:glycosyltransferase involved in cell wall biosynthesis